MNKRYWLQKANPWVSGAVLCGGVLSACLLAVVYHIESRIDTNVLNIEAQISTQIEHQELPRR
jgi:hypothetical protein